jgi:membrane protein insertase Oxa1/YidC/SpoIIIJ
MGVELPAAVFGSLALIAGILMYWIPETLFSPMHQTIEAAEAAKEDFRIPCCSKPLDRENDRKTQKRDQDNDVIDTIV